MNLIQVEQQVDIYTLKGHKTTNCLKAYPNLLFRYPTPSQTLSEQPLLGTITRILNLLHQINTALFGITINLLNRRQVIPAEDIQIRRLELPCRHLPLKEHIHLTIRASLWLRKSEVNPHHAEETGACPEESRFSGPAPAGGFRGELVGGEDVDDDTADVVDVSRQDDGFGAEAGGGDFGNERVADGADREIVDECEKEEHGADCPAGGDVRFRCDGSEADDEEEDEEDAGAVEVDTSSAGAHHEEPGAEGSYHSESVLGH